MKRTVNNLVTKTHHRLQLHYHKITVGRFLPEGGIKNVFSVVKTRLAKIFLPAKIGLCQNCHQTKLEP